MSNKNNNTNDSFTTEIDLDELKKVGFVTRELDLEALKQVGTDGGTIDYRKPLPFVPSMRTATRKQLIKSAPIEKDIDDYTEEDFNDYLPKYFKDKGWVVDPKTVKFTQAEKYIHRNDELVTLTSFQFSPMPPSLFTDNTDLLKALDKVKVPKLVTFKENTPERYLNVLVGDFQIGQADADGAAGIIGRILQIPALIKEEIRKNKVLKTPITKIYVNSLGDLVEGVAYFYNTQNFAVTLDRREQTKIARRLFTRILTEISGLGIPMTVVTVPGNHGENRNMGGAFTTINDNDDVAVVEQIADAFELAPEKFGHIEFLFPEPERLSLTINQLGHSIGLVHGHQVGSPRQLGASVRNYLNGQSKAKEALGNVDYLFLGHFHHYYVERVSEQTTAVMNGAMCKDSDHFKQRYGLSSPPCFVMGVITREGDEGFIPFYLKDKKE